MNIWLDLDKTIWNCYDNTGSNEIWAKQLVGKIQQSPINPNICYDDIGQSCLLQEGFKDFCTLYHSSINLNFISAGAQPLLCWNNQPSIKLLRNFGLYDYFCNKILDYKTLKKAHIISNLTDKNSILVDDDEDQLKIAKDLNIKIINRNQFNSWKTFITLLI